MNRLVIFIVIVILATFAAQRVSALPTGSRAAEPACGAYSL